MAQVSNPVYEHELREDKPNMIVGHVHYDVDDEEERRNGGGDNMTRATSRRDGADLTTAVWSLGGPLSLILFSGIIQAASAVQICQFVPCVDFFAYSVSVGIISSILISLYLVFFTFARSAIPEKSMMYLSGFLFLWWMVAVGILTFSTPTGSAVFVVGTGYFATWISFLLCGFVVHTEFHQFQHFVTQVNSLDSGDKATFYLLLASLVELISSAVVCGGDGFCTGYDIYGMVVGGVSVTLCVLLLRVDADSFRGMDKTIAVFLCFWWAIGMGVLTIMSPFVNVGNGFFATWMAFFTSFFVAEQRLFPRHF